MENNAKYELILDMTYEKLEQLSIFTNTVKIQSLLDYIDELKVKYL